MNRRAAAPCGFRCRVIRVLDLETGDDFSHLLVRVVRSPVPADLLARTEPYRSLDSDGDDVCGFPCAFRGTGRGIADHRAGLAHLRGRAVATPTGVRRAIVACVASLLLYKYTRFLLPGDDRRLVAFAGQSRAQRRQSALARAPPLAISFFVFEFVHYLLDVYRGESPLRNPLDFLLFAIFWPSIVAGPVKRYQEFVPSLHQGVAGLSKHDVSGGVLLVALGLAKKIVADNLTAYVTFRQDHLAEVTLGYRWFFLPGDRTADPLGFQRL